MSMQSKEKKRRGPAMSSTEKITKGDASEDALPTESALLGPDNPTNAGGGGQDEQGEALVISEKAEVGEKIMNEPGVAVKRCISATKRKIAYKQIKGKKNSPSGTPKNSPAMSLTAKITKGNASEDALPIESALLGPDNPTNAGGGGQANKTRRWSFQKKQWWERR